MTFLPECGAFTISIEKDFSLFQWMHNDFMYVRFGGMRNTKTWSKSVSVVMCQVSTRALREHRPPPKARHDK